MRRKGVFRLQLAATILFAVTAVLCGLCVMLQNTVKSIFTNEPEVLNLFIVPVPVLLQAVFPLLPAFVFLILCRFIRSQLAGWISVILLLTVFCAAMFFVFPPMVQSSMEEANRKGIIYYMSYISIYWSILYISRLLNGTGIILMIISMGGFISHGKPSKPETGLITHTGAVLLQAVSVCIYGAALFICLNIQNHQDTFLNEINDSLIGRNVIPWNTLLQILIMLGIGGIYLLAGFFRTTRRSSRITAAIITVLLCLASMVFVGIPMFVSYQYSLINDTEMLKAYSVIEGTVSEKTRILFGAASVLMFLSLGAFYGKASKRMAGRE